MRDENDFERWFFSHRADWLIYVIVLMAIAGAVEAVLR
jgi:hypothetical protein